MRCALCSISCSLTSWMSWPRRMPATCGDEAELSDAQRQRLRRRLEAPARARAEHFDEDVRKRPARAGHARLEDRTLSADAFEDLPTRDTGALELGQPSAEANDAANDVLRFGPWEGRLGLGQRSRSLRATGGESEDQQRGEEQTHRGRGSWAATSRVQGAEKRAEELSRPLKKSRGHRAGLRRPAGSLGRKRMGQDWALRHAAYGRSEPASAAARPSRLGLSGKA
jgi:hypothetical protein